MLLRLAQRWTSLPLLVSSSTVWQLPQLMMVIFPLNSTVLVQLFSLFSFVFTLNGTTTLLDNLENLTPASCQTAVSKEREFLLMLGFLYSSSLSSLLLSSSGVLPLLNGLVLILSSSTSKPSLLIWRASS